jgi:hypothetical protein
MVPQVKKKAIYCRYYEGSIYVEYLWGYIITRRGILMEGKLCVLSEIFRYGNFGSHCTFKIQSDGDAHWKMFQSWKKRKICESCCVYYRKVLRCTNYILFHKQIIIYGIWIYKCNKFQLDLRSRSKTRWIKGTKKQAVIFKWTVLYKIII